MDTKNQIIKAASTWYIITKVVYVLSCVATISFIALAIILPLTTQIKTMSKAEEVIMLSTLALYSFFLIGLLWNVEMIFKSIKDGNSPFALRVTHYLKKTGIFIILLSTVPALVGSILIKIVEPLSETVYPIECAGIVMGILVLVLCAFFKYGAQLQEKDDETL